MLLLAQRRDTRYVSQDISMVGRNFRRIVRMHVAGIAEIPQKDTRARLVERRYSKVGSRGETYANDVP